jgi:hypothetical protein
MSATGLLAIVLAGSVGFQPAAADSMEWVLLAAVAAGALIWAFAWSRRRPLYRPRTFPRHHFLRVRQKELRPR